ncbi:UNKNOWN [Stylonychia lemnae]|uniref:Uncharacterized protein n=1 Tax=Stylonychia lemnae TaxID=5949 RepID=A0A077ZQF2_STYLE|nr:UNKNOWN [Stylonychia lemnae]|eukprot:CDW72138.1 UNKNOWN [Stylonychia lemnae]
MQNRKKSQHRKSIGTANYAAYRSKSRPKSPSYTLAKNFNQPAKKSHANEGRSNKKFKIKLTENFNNHNTTTTTVQNNNNHTKNSKKTSLSKKKRRSGRESLDMTYIQTNKRKLDMFGVGNSTTTSHQKHGDTQVRGRVFSPNERSNSQKSQSRSRGSSHYKPVHHSTQQNNPRANCYSFNHTPRNHQSLDKRRTKEEDQDHHPIYNIPSETAEDDQKSTSHYNTQTRNHTESRYSSSCKYDRDQEQEHLSKELAQAKNKIYEQKFKIDTLKKQMHELESENKSIKDKFHQEQDKSDEFFTKAEKYKMIAKDFRREIENLQVQIEELKLKIEQETKNYETIFRIKEENDIRELKQRSQLQQSMLENLRHLQGIASQIDKQCLMINPINDLFEQIQMVNQQNFESSHQNGIRPYDEVTLSQEGDNIKPNNICFRSMEEKDMKIAPDAIMYSGESINVDDQQQNFDYNQQQQMLAMYQHQQQIIDSTNKQHKPPNEDQTPSIRKYHQNRSDKQQHVSNSNNVSQNNIPLVMNSQNQLENTANSYNQSFQQSSSTYNQGHQMALTQSQFEGLQRIQQEMISLREQSKRVLDENITLNERNQRLQDQLEEIKTKSEQQSLLPQYKEAFEQLRKANENMQKKIEMLEQERNHVNLTLKVEQDLKEMAEKISKYDYENQNLREERDLFVQQIQNLEQFNRNQEKMIHYFQQQQQQLQQNMSNLQMNQQSQVITTQPSLAIEGTSSNMQYNLNVPLMRKTSNTNLVNSSSSNNIKQQINRVADLQNNLTNDDQNLLSDLSKSPTSQYFSNRTDNYNQVHAFTLNQHTNSDFNLTQSILNKSNSRGTRMSNLNPQQNNLINTESSMYLETTNNERNDILQQYNTTNNMLMNDQENLFSLSSTYPDRQMRLHSPSAHHNQSNQASNSNSNTAGNNLSISQLNTGNFKNSTMKEQFEIKYNDGVMPQNPHMFLQQQPTIQSQQQQYQYQMQQQLQHQFSQQSSMPPKSSTRSVNLHINDINQSQSQEVTNRDKNQFSLNKLVGGGRVLQPTSISSYQFVNNQQQNLKNHDIVTYEMESSDNSNKMASGGNNNKTMVMNEFSEDSSSSLSNNNLNSDRSLEKHLQALRIQNQNLLNSQLNNFSHHHTSQVVNINKYPSEETSFQVSNSNAPQSSSIHSLSLYPQKFQQDYQIDSKPSQNRQIYNTMNQQQKNIQLQSNKENLMMIDDEFIFQNGLNQLQQQCSSKNITSSKIKSPAFYESHNNFSDTELINIDCHQPKGLFNQQIMMDNIITQSKHQTESYCTTDKQNTLTHCMNGTNFNISDSQVASTTNKNGSVSGVSNFMSERTLNLKKEITSLDEEILLLQNSLKQALIKKGGAIAAEEDRLTNS